jgi:hypothetical protein
MSNLVLCPKSTLVRIYFHVLSYVSYLYVIGLVDDNDIALEESAECLMSYSLLQPFMAQHEQYQNNEQDNE